MPAAALRGTTAGFWLRLRNEEGQAVLNAKSSHQQGIQLSGVTVFRFDPAGSFLDRIEAKSATLERLRGPGLRAGSGVTLAGQSFGTQTASGRIGGSAHVSTAKPIGERYVVSLPATSAVTVIARY